jgi:hypothetical protein
MSSIGINLSLNPGFRRGEGGWVDAGWAFMVARGGMLPIHQRARVCRRTTAGYGWRYAVRHGGRP